MNVDCGTVDCQTARSNQNFGILEIVWMPTLSTLSYFRKTRLTDSFKKKSYFILIKIKNWFKLKIHETQTKMIKVEIAPRGTESIETRFSSSRLHSAFTLIKIWAITKWKMFDWYLCLRNSTIVILHISFPLMWKASSIKLKSSF